MSAASPQAAPSGDLAEVELDAFEGRPAERVDLGRSLPFGWWPIVALSLVALVDRIEANVVAAIVPDLQREFGIGDGWTGAIPTATLLAGVLLVLPAGRIADTRHRLGTIIAIVTAWSVFTVGSAVAPVFAVFFLFRVVLGAAGQLDNPPVSSLVADFAPPRARAKAYSLERFASYAGLPIALALGGVLAQLFGWRWALALMAVPGLLVVLALLTLREPRRGIGDEIGRLTGDVPVVDAAREPDPMPTLEVDHPEALRRPLLAQVRELLRIETLRSIVVGVPILFFAIGGIFFWLPSFFERTAGLGEAAAGGIAGGVGLLGMGIGFALGGRLGDRGHRRRPNWRMRLGGFGLLAGSAAFALMVVVPVLAAQIAMLTVSVAFLSIAVPNLTAASADVMPMRRRGMGFAMLQFALTLGSALGPLLIGIVSEAFDGDLRIAFAVPLALLLPGALVVLRGSRSFDRDCDVVLGKPV